MTHGIEDWTPINRGKTDAERLNELEEAVLEQSIVMSYLFDRLGLDLDDLLQKLFTRPDNIKIIAEGLKDSSDIHVLERCTNRWTNHQGKKRIITGVQ